MIHYVEDDPNESIVQQDMILNHILNFGNEEQETVSPRKNTTFKNSVFNINSY